MSVEEEVKETQLNDESVMTYSNQYRTRAGKLEKSLENES